MIELTELECILVIGSLNKALKENTELQYEAEINSIIQKMQGQLEHLDLINEK